MPHDRGTILIVGASSYVGHFVNHAVTSQFSHQFNVDITYNASPIKNPLNRFQFKMDITSPPSIKAVLSKSQPQIVINLAAITDISKCEKDPTLCEKVNVPASFIDNIPKDTLLIHF